MSNYSISILREPKNIIPLIFFGYSIAYASGAAVNANSWALLLITLFFSFFFLGWIFLRRSLKLKTIDALLILDKRQAEILKILSIFTVIVLMIYGIYKISNVGWFNYFFVTRAARALLTREDFLLSIFDDLIIGVFWLIISIDIFSNRKITASTYSIAIIITIYSLLSISLSTLVFVIIPFFVAKYWNIGTRYLTVVVGVMVLIVVAALWKPLLGSVFIGYSLSADDIKFPAEFTTWVDVYDNVSNAGGKWATMWYGESFADTIKSLFFPLNKVESLSVLYSEQFEANVYEAGGGRGFSLPVEAYLNFKWVGVALIGFVSGMVLKFITLKARKSVFYTFLFIACSALLFKLFRSESYSLLKNLVWLQIVPVLVLILSTKFMCSILLTKDGGRSTLRKNGLAKKDII